LRYPDASLPGDTPPHPVGDAGQLAATRSTTSADAVAAPAVGADVDLSEAMIGHARRGLLARYDKSEMSRARVAIQERCEHWVAAVVQGGAPSA
jgi:hypothetical protein